MAYTLKNTGVASVVQIAVAVDEDGLISAWKTPGAGRDWSTSSGLTKHADVNTGTATFRSSTSKGWFQTYETASVFTPKGVAFSGGNVVMTTRASDTDGFAGFAVMAGADFDGGPSTNAIFSFQKGSVTSGSATDDFIRVNKTTGYYEGYFSSFVRFDTDSTATTLGTTLDNTVPFSLGFNYLHSGTGAGGQFFVGLESSAGSSLSLHTLSGDGNQYNGSYYLTGLGGQYFQSDHTTPSAAVGNSAPGKYHLWVVFTRTLTESEFRSLHDDWFGTLFESGASGAVSKLALLGVG